MWNISNVRDKLADFKRIQKYRCSQLGSIKVMRIPKESK